MTVKCFISCYFKYEVDNNLNIYLRNWSLVEVKSESFISEACLPSAVRDFNASVSCKPECLLGAGEGRKSGETLPIWKPTPHLKHKAATQLEQVFGM